VKEIGKMRQKNAEISVWKNRIVEFKEMPVAELIENPKNWRKHTSKQEQALFGVLTEVGVVQNVIFNQRTGRLVDGHLRVSLATKNGESTLPTTIVDLSDEEEDLILATLDPLSALAGTDAEKHALLLDHIETRNVEVQALIDALKKAPPDIEEPSVKDYIDSRLFTFSLSNEEAETIDRCYKAMRDKHPKLSDAELFLTTALLGEEAAT